MKDLGNVCKYLTERASVCLWRTIVVSLINKDILFIFQINNRLHCTIFICFQNALLPLHANKTA